MESNASGSKRADEESAAAVKASSPAAGSTAPAAAVPDAAAAAQDVPQHPPPLFPLREFFREASPSTALPRVRVIDVGAMLLGEAEDVWKPLLRRGHCEAVVGFEPCAEECERLNEDAKNKASSDSVSFHFLPWALGDGSRGQFRRCSAAMTSSMLEPNIPLLRRFVQLEEVTTVVERSEMQTRRLDELLPQIPGESADFLKIDVQGGELAVLKGAQKALQDVLVVHTEVEFVDMYEHQPLFAEVDQCLRSSGFVFHRFSSIHGRPMKPLHLAANPLQPISQQLWADAVYVRDLWELSGHSREQLLKLALILHEVYHSYDVVLHVLQKFDATVAKAYLDRVLGAR